MLPASLGDEKASRSRMQLPMNDDVVIACDLTLAAPCLGTAWSKEFFTQACIRSEQEEPCTTRVSLGLARGGGGSAQSLGASLQQTESKPWHFGTSAAHPIGARRRPPGARSRICQRGAPAAKQLSTSVSDATSGTKPSCLSAPWSSTGRSLPASHIPGSASSAARSTTLAS